MSLRCNVWAAGLHITATKLSEKVTVKLEQDRESLLLSLSLSILFIRYTIR